MEHQPDFPRGRTILVVVLLTLLISTLLGRALWPEWANDPGSDRLHEALSQLLWYGLLALTLYIVARVARVDHRRLIGVPVAPRRLLPFAAWAIPAVALSLATAYLLFIPISYIDPEKIEELVVETAMSRHLATGITFDLPNLLLFASIGIAGPLVEEYAFRGLLLSSWATKWGTARGVVMSSAAFAVWHIDPLGGFVFGYAAAVAYLATGSIWAPVVLHLTNNSIAFAMAAIGSTYADPEATRSLQQFQDQWYVGLLAAAIGLPWGIAVFRRYRFMAGRPIPYVLAQRYTSR